MPCSTVTLRLLIRCFRNPRILLGSAAMTRAPYACDPARSRGRLHPQAESPVRTAFQRDRDRIIHATAFRRLKHKTQVFVAHEGDHYRTRLTHSLEVAQISRTLARALALDEDLAETLALSHDLGHTAFGHAGEDALDAKMTGFGGFDHNAQALRIVTGLEQRYPGFDGLNLSWESLEGLVKHNGPLVAAPASPQAIAALPFGFEQYHAQQDLWLDSYASAEAQVAAIADDIAYDNHDIDDGLRAGLFTLADLLDVPLVGTLWQQIEVRWPQADEDRRVAELVRDLIGAMVEDVLAETQRRIVALAPAHADDIRRASGAVVGFSAVMAAQEAQLKAFLYARMYRNPRVIAVREKVQTILADLFDRYAADPTALPAGWTLPPGELDMVRARHLADFIAGMTDRFAVREHERLFGETLAASLRMF
jgi:dGTPase